MASVLTVNIGHPESSAYKRGLRTTGIGKRPVADSVEVRAPGPKTVGLGSGLVGDFIGDGRHHGGDDQAVYAFEREDLDRWAERLGRELPNGSFGENLTTTGLDVNGALLGERWRVSSAAHPDDAVELEVTAPRIPCATFRGWMGEPGWVKTFTADGRTGAYLKVTRAGRIRAGDTIDVVFRPDHDVSVELLFRATTTERERLPELLAAVDYLDAETRGLIERRELFVLD